MNTPNGSVTNHAHKGNGLTPQDVARLTARFDLDDHEVKPQLSDAKAKERNYQLYMPYIGEEAITLRLYEIDPNWTLRIDRVEARDSYYAAYVSLTVAGVTRHGVGTGSLDEIGEKGAATDGLKRAARLFGIGVYLKRMPGMFVDLSNRKKQMAEATEKLKAWLGEQVTTPRPFFQVEAKVYDWLSALHKDKGIDGESLSDFSRRALGYLNMHLNMDAGRFGNFAGYIEPGEAAKIIADAADADKPDDTDAGLLWALIESEGITADVVAQADILHGTSDLRSLTVDQLRAAYMAAREESDGEPEADTDEAPEAAHPKA